PNQVFIWMNDPIRLRQGGRNLIFFTKNSRCEFFVKKKQKYHAAAGESGFRVWHAAGTVRTA
ncbi:MAG: hypothetical protein ACLFVO_20990, partial [Chloroflexaceae bacterium]